jgi:hypothetical protein
VDEDFDCRRHDRVRGVGACRRGSGDEIGGRRQTLFRSADDRVQD